MRLLGVNRSPPTRRVAVTLRMYGLHYEQHEVSGFDNRDEVRAANPLGRIPALILDTGEALVDSHAIVDHLDETYGGDCPSTPRSGPERRAVLRVAALAMGACDKGLQAAYARNRHPAEKRHQPWIDDCMGQMAAALGAIDGMVGVKAEFLLLARLTQADVCAFVAERLARGLGIDTAARMPRLYGLTRGLGNLLPFASTEP